MTPVYVDDIYSLLFANSTTTQRKNYLSIRCIEMQADTVYSGNIQGGPWKVGLHEYMVITSVPPPRTISTRLKPSVNTSKNSMSSRNTLRKTQHNSTLLLFYHIISVYLWRMVDSGNYVTYRQPAKLDYFNCTRHKAAIIRLSHLS